MMANLKKMFILIPFMILGLFLFSEINVSAINTKLVGAKGIVVGGANSKENTYYFTNKAGWEFNTEYNVLTDTYLTYRVIRPDGKATPESDKINYVNSGGVFTISDIKKLNYNQSVNMAGRVSVAPAATYYVEIKYYGAYLGFITWEQDKNETLKIVYGGDDNHYPSASISYDVGSDKYTVSASASVDGRGYSVIDSIEYYFFETEVDNEIATFRANMKESADQGSVSSFEKNSNVTAEIAGVSESNHKYLYVMVTTANNYSTIVSYEIGSGNSDDAGSGEHVSSTGDGSGDKGLFDYEFGELILLVLVVVLIVSCALIITQKIVDYKKRLY